MINESNKSTAYKTNYSDVFLQCAKQKIYKTGKTREVCKDKDCIKCLNECCIINLYQGIHIGKKEINIQFDKCFGSKHKLMLKQNNNDKKIHKCSECDECFTLKSHFNIHQGIYIGKKPYKCSQCDKCFAQKYSYQKHQRIHTVGKPYKCSECDKCFAQKYIYKKHHKIHTAGKPYKCSECDKSFIDKYHVRIYTGEKPYKCSECDKCYHQNASLECHLRTHTGEKPYKCSE